MTRLANEISVLKFVRADRSSEFDGLLAQIDPRGPSRARGSCYDGSTTRRTGDQRTRRAFGVEIGLGSSSFTIWRENRSST